MTDAAAWGSRRFSDRVALPPLIGAGLHKDTPEP